MKIILLGDSGVGKTSLLNNLEQKRSRIKWAKNVRIF
jgi:GTPase SAR1 family protein